MATTIKSTALDFNNIKNNLKQYLAAQSEFTDYNFEASALSNLLDVLAYNTHINALVANFALNESYLGTAQLRSSLVSLAEGIGYIPDTDTASQAVVNITLDASDDAGRNADIQLPAGTSFTTNVDDVSYTFQTNDIYFASDDGTGTYEFKTSAGSSEVVLFEGTQKTKTFFVGETTENPVYVIPDTKLDADTVKVRVYESATSSSFTTYNALSAASTINANSTIYILKEAPNGFFEITFGDGITFGKAPTPGQKIEISYISTNGAVANGAAVFTPTSQFSAGLTSPVNLTVITTTNSVGGDEKETIESIRKNAPFQYATQNRMVTAADYSALILRNYSTLIQDIISWGGEENTSPDFGAVYVSILFEDDVSADTIATTRTGIRDLAAQLAVISFRLEFEDPVTTFIEVQNFFQFNPNLTTDTLNTVQSNVLEEIQSYFTLNTGKFNQSFRRSNLLSLIDDESPAVLSSRANIKMQQRVTPTLNKKNNFALRFPAAIAIPDDNEFSITSSSFNIGSQTCLLRNRLSSNVLQIVEITTGDIVVDNVGSYNATSGTVNIVGLEPSSIVGTDSFIKVSCVPANQSAITPTRNEVLEYDANASFATGVITTAQN